LKGIGMGYIKILDESVSNIIAAGEVVENPASMIKEMIENSLDAKATVIKIEVFKGGTEVKINDNGIGMDKEDTLLSIERHATSKISTKDDVFNLQTYGFRGEALASIAAVSKLTITTRTAASNTGYRIGSYGGVVRKFEEISRNPGTEIEVRDLFYNTPARKKFLRKESTEYNKIRDIVLKEALANTEVAFILELDGKATINTSGRGIDNTILELFGKSVLRNLNKFEYGYLGNVEILRSSKDYIFTYINKRYVKSATIERAVIDGYYTKLMKGKYPFAIIFFDIDPAEIDVNVHPSKKIVKFSNDKAIYRQLKDSIDEFFYHNDRENWQPNIDLLKQNINVENKDEKISNLFSDEIVKTDSQKFFSFETHDGNFSGVNSDVNKGVKFPALSSPSFETIVVTGSPTVPNAVGVEFAIRHINAAFNGLNPSDTIIAAGIATAVPYPAIPSMNPPNPHASTNACALLSVVIFPSIFFTVSIFPVFTDRSYANNAAITTNPIGIHATANPSSMEASIPCTGILHAGTTNVKTIAVNKLVYALNIADFFNPANKTKNKIIGTSPIKNKLISLYLLSLFII